MVIPARLGFRQTLRLVTNEMTGATRRLETRLLVRDAVGAGLWCDLQMAQRQ